ncbi:MAG: TrbI/VirB10 family protein [Sphingomicrobium sp.]
MPVSEIGDPRLQALFGANDPRDGGVRPTVRLPRKGLPPIAIGIIAVAIALLLFLVLNERRTRQAEPNVQSRASDNPGAWAAPPPLYIPPVEEPARPAIVPPAEPETKVAAVPAPVAAVHSPVQAVRPPPEPAPPLVQPLPQQAPLAQRSAGGSPLVIDTGAAPEGNAPVAGRPGIGFNGPRTESATRMRAGALANPSMTVPQGYLIPAVLETGFDSTRAGYARAVVSRDVRGFDGKNVLIPRGSRLIGQSDASVARGQNRAVITWTRLIRPDGMTIDLDSPAVDPAGRTGVAASVNSHFFGRLGDALLQSTFAIGQAFAGRAVTGPVVVVSGNAATAGAQLMPAATNYVPTLKVAPGKSISVFVAHDLDFSAAGAGR